MDELELSCATYDPVLLFLLWKFACQRYVCALKWYYAIYVTSNVVVTNVGPIPQPKKLHVVESGNEA